MFVISGGVFWSGCKKRKRLCAQADQSADYVLSDSTKTVIGKLESPVEIRFYALLDTTYAPETNEESGGPGR